VTLGQFCDIFVAENGRLMESDIFMVCQTFYSSRSASNKLMNHLPWVYVENQVFTRVFGNKLKITKITKYVHRFFKTANRVCLMVS